MDPGVPVAVAVLAPEQEATLFWGHTDYYLISTPLRYIFSTDGWLPIGMDHLPGRGRLVVVSLRRIHSNGEQVPSTREPEKENGLQKS